MAALPEDHAHAAEDDEHDEPDQRGRLADTPDAHRIGRLDMRGKVAPRGGLMRVRLYGSHFVQRLVDERADIGDAVLARARGSPHAPPDHHHREDDQRADQDHDQGEPRAGHQQHAERTGQQQRIAQGEGKPVSHHRLQERGVVGEARNHLTGADGLEIRGREGQDMVEHRAADVRDDALAGTEHQEEPGVGGCREEYREAERGGQRAVEHLGTGGGEPCVDYIAKALPERENAGSRHQQRDHRGCNAQPVGSEEPRQAQELGEVAAARTVRQAVIEHGH